MKENFDNDKKMMCLTYNNNCANLQRTMNHGLLREWIKQLRRLSNMIITTKSASDFRHFDN